MDTPTFTPDRAVFRAAVEAIALKAKATLPEANGRVDLAVRLVLQGDVELLADGTAQVFSQSNGVTSYHLVNGVCDCADYERAPSQWCKHRIAHGLLKRALAATPQAPPVVVPEGLEPWADNDFEDPEPEAAPVLDAPEPPAPAPLPEAPASVNVRVTTQGREVQWTLRDTDEARLAVRLEALLARYPVSQPQPPAQPLSAAQHNALAMHRPITQTGWCAVHNLEMTQNEKNGQRWFSHRLPEGGFCKGR